MSELAGNLLLVDDDEAKRYVIATWLRRAGHTVTEARTGQEALGKVEAAELVLLDVILLFTWLQAGDRHLGGMLDREAVPDRGRLPWRQD
jgi:CheY-like chemotaxis protein